MKTFIAACFACICLPIALPLWAETPPPMPAVTQPITKNIVRIAPPLATLIKQHKRDPNAEAEIISRKTEITIDENYFRIDFAP